jgi:hypothetical protein
MVAAWPGTVSQYAVVGTYQEEPDRNVSTFQPDRGPPLDHRSTSISSDQIQFSTEMVYATFQTLRDFYRTTLKDGALPFTRKHPYDIAGADQTFKFIEAPKWNDLGNVYGRVSISLRRLP